MKNLAVFLIGFLGFCFFVVFWTWFLQLTGAGGQKVGGVAGNTTQNVNQGPLPIPGLSMGGVNPIL